MSTAPTRAESGEQRRDLIIAAAEAGLSESGIAGTTLAGVGEQVGLSKGRSTTTSTVATALPRSSSKTVCEAVREEATRSVGDDASPLERLPLSAGLTSGSPSSVRRVS
ncbi:MAG: hypothetical protein R2697_00895 [Ilumatobacteraceae bacterium]